MEIERVWPHIVPHIVSVVSVFCRASKTGYVASKDDVPQAAGMTKEKTTMIRSFFIWDSPLWRFRLRSYLLGIRAGDGNGRNQFIENSPGLAR